MEGDELGQDREKTSDGGRTIHRLMGGRRMGRGPGDSWLEAWRIVRPLLDPPGLLHLEGAMENMRPHPMAKEREETSCCLHQEALKDSLSSPGPRHPGLRCPSPSSSSGKRWGSARPSMSPSRVTWCT